MPLPSTTKVSQVGITNKIQILYAFRIFRSFRPLQANDKQTHKQHRLQEDVPKAPCSWALLRHQTGNAELWYAESVWCWFKNVFLELRGRPAATASVHLNNFAHRTGTVAATMPGTLKASIPHHQCTSTEELRVLPSRNKSKTHHKI